MLRAYWGLHVKSWERWLFCSNKAPKKPEIDEFVLPTSAWRCVVCPLQRRNWIWFGLFPEDEHADWKKFHQYMFVLLTVIVTWVTLYMIFAMPDWWVLYIVFSVLKVLLVFYISELLYCFWLLTAQVRPCVYGTLQHNSIAWLCGTEHWTFQAISSRLGLSRSTFRNSTPWKSWFAIYQ